MLVTLVLEKAPRNWCGYTPDDGLCIIVAAKTRKILIRQFRTVLKLHIAYLHEEGRNIPRVTHVAIREELPTKRIMPRWQHPHPIKRQYKAHRRPA